MYTLDCEIYEILMTCFAFTFWVEFPRVRYEITDTRMGMGMKQIVY